MTAEGTKDYSYAKFHSYAALTRPGIRIKNESPRRNPTSSIDSGGNQAKPKHPRRRVQNRKFWNQAGKVAHSQVQEMVRRQPRVGRAVHPTDGCRRGPPLPRNARTMGAKQVHQSHLQL